MGRIRRSFDIQFKIRVCQAIESGKPIPELCREYQLQRAVIEGWFKRHLRGELAAKLDGDKPGELERENEKLKAKVGELIMQIDALKKLASLRTSSPSERGWIVSGGGLDLKGKPAKPVVLLPAPSTTSKRDRH
jgi:transposase-like protein